MKENTETPVWKIKKKAAGKKAMVNERKIPGVKLRCSVGVGEKGWTSCGRRRRVTRSVNEK